MLAHRLATYILLHSLNSAVTFKVSERNVQAGIGYVTISHDRLLKVDFLSWMGELEFVMITASPKEVSSYLTLFRPLDSYTWCFLTVLFLLMVMLLFTIYSTTSNKKVLHRGLHNSYLMKHKKSHLKPYSQQHG